MGNVRVYKIKDGKIPKWNKNLVLDINADPRNQKTLVSHWIDLIEELKEEPEGPQAVRSYLFKIYTLRRENMSVIVALTVLRTKNWKTFVPYLVGSD